MRWIWVLGNKDTVIGGKTLPVAKNWEQWTSSIMAYPFRSPLLGRSELVDVTHDAARAPVWGVVREWRVLSRDDAAALGIDQRDDAALYAGVDQTAGGEFEYVSPSIQFDYIDEDGIQWPAVIDHIAVTGWPHNQKRQPPQSDLVGVALARGFSMAKKDTESTSVKMAEVDDDALDGAVESASNIAQMVSALSDTVSALVPAVNELTSRVDAMISAPVAADDAGVAESEQSAQVTATINELVKQVGDVRAEMRRGDSDAIAGALKMSRDDVDRMKRELSSASWARLRAAAANAGPVATDRVSASAVAMNRNAAHKTDAAGRDREAARLQREKNITYREALRLANTKGV